MLVHAFIKQTSVTLVSCLSTTKFDGHFVMSVGCAKTKMTPEIKQPLVSDSLLSVLTLIMSSRFQEHFLFHVILTGVGFIHLKSWRWSSFCIIPEDVPTLEQFKGSHRVALTNIRRQCLNRGVFNNNKWPQCFVLEYTLSSCISRSCTMSDPVVGAPLLLYGTPLLRRV